MTELTPDIKRGRRLLGLTEDKVSDVDDEDQLLKLYPLDDDGKLIIPMIDGTMVHKPLRFRTIGHG